MQYYSEVSREGDAYALPDVEVFYVSEFVDPDVKNEDSAFVDEDGEYSGDGWYWWYCFPGCMPDSDPIGPFDTEELAVADMRENA